MGNSGAKPELDTYIRYRYKGYTEEIEIVFANLKNKARYTKKLPSDSQLKKDFEAFASKITATADSKKVIENLPKKYKWRLLCRHADIISGKCKTGNSTKSALEKHLERLINEPSVYSFRNLFEEIKSERAEHEEIFWKDFKNYRGPQILLELLNSQAMFAKQSSNYDLLLKLLEFIHYMITTFDHGVDYLKRANGGIQAIVGCINENHPVVTGYVYDITAQFLVGSDEDFDSICRGFGDYKNTHSLPSRFQVLINILKDSPNVILIRNTLQFLFTFITLPSNKTRASLIRQELLELNIENVFELILGRINMEKYSIKDCTEEAYLKRIKQTQNKSHFQDGPVDPGLSNLKSILASSRLNTATINESDEIEEEDTYHDEYSLDHSHHDNDDGDEHDHDDLDDDFQQLSVTLCEKDGKVFAKHLKGIQELMHLFLTVNLEKAEIGEHSGAGGIGGGSGIEISFDSLTEKLKKKAFDYDCYDQLVGSLQKLLLLPNDQEKVKKVFSSLDKALSKIFTQPQGAISEKDLIGVLEAQGTQERLVKQLQDAEQINRNKDAEIKAILVDKDELVVKFNNSRNASTQMEMQIQNLLEEINKLKSATVAMQQGISSAPSQQGVPQAPQLSGIPSAPSLSGVPQAPQLSGIPQAPSLSGVPQAPQIQGVPQAPQLSGVPMAPQLSGVPQAPQLSGVPQAPQLSGVPQAPQLSGVPQAPQLSGIPQAPSLSGVPQAPQLSGIPSAPQISGIPSAPNISGIPSAPSLSGVPQAPQLSGVPQAPALFGIPQAPSLSGVPTAPSISGVPQAPSLSGVPMAPSLSGVPMAPSLSGVPKAPSLSGVPQAPSLSGVPQAPSLSGVPQAPSFSGIPQAPSFSGVPQAPSMFGGPPTAPSLNIPSAPSLGGIPSAPSAPALFGAPAAPSLSFGAPSAPNIGFPMAPSIGGFGGAPNLNLPMMSVPVGPPVKAKRKPAVPLKPFMWNTVTANSIKNTIWEKVNDEKVKLDTAFLESQFEKPAVVAKVPAGGSAPGAAAAQAVMTKVSLIAADRTKTMEIVIMKLKMSPSLLANALITVDEKILTLNNLQSLSNICPKQEEADAVTSYISGGGNPDDLGSPEKFILEIKVVNGYADRIKSLLFTHTYEEMFQDLEPKVAKMRQAVVYLKDTKIIPEMLEYVLAVGNYLNGESARGGAWGFRFDSLIKISELMMKDNKTTLMMYVVEQLEAKHPGELFISPEDEVALSLMESLPISQLNADLNEIKKNNRFVAKAIQSQTSAPQDNIKSKLDGLGTKIDERIAAIEADIKFIDENYKATAVLYCEKPTDPSEQFAQKFGALFRKIKKDKADKLKIEEAKKKEELKKAKEEAAKTAAANKKVVPPPGAFKLPPVGATSLKPPTPNTLAPKVAEGEPVRGTFLGMQTMKAGESRMSKCYQNVRETLLLAKNKTGLIGVINEMKLKKKLEGNGDDKKEDLDSAISKLGFLNGK